MCKLLYLSLVIGDFDKYSHYNLCNILITKLDISAVAELHKKGAGSKRKRAGFEIIVICL